jgi:zinc transporter 9
LYYLGIGGIGVAAIMGIMGLYLASINHQFLLGQAVDNEIVIDIKNIMLSRSSVDDVHGIQSQWIGPYAFSYKAEVDFDGTFLAAKLMARYQVKKLLLYCCHHHIRSYTIQPSHIYT